MAALPADRTGSFRIDPGPVRERLQAANSIAELTGIFQEAIDGLGVFLVAEINDPRNFPGDNLVFGTVDAKYLQEYWTSGRAFHDPFVRVSMYVNRPIRFKDAVANVVCSAEDQRTMKAHARAGMADGYAFPMKGRRNRFCNVSIHGTMPVQGLPAETVANLEILAMALYRRGTDLCPLPPTLHPPGSAILTKRERECLTWVAQGKTNWDIAELMGISERTVQYHVDNACKKLDVPGRLQAVVRAARLLEIMI